ncbi:hypothetical protein LB507_008429 [Fusarium sp. FIESC RH6]|nr:hypothetical protein LB507_008429 [Fusarium sp. FIESC RH6]
MLAATTPSSQPFLKVSTNEVWMCRVVTDAQLEQPLPPLYILPKSEYVHRHEQGTLIEQKNELEVLLRFNEQRTLFKAWPVAPISVLTTSFQVSWLVLVVIPKQSEGLIFPSLEDNFHIDFESRVEMPNGTFSLVNLPATRIVNPYEDTDHPVGMGVANCAAFKVDVCRSWKDEDGEQVSIDLMAEKKIASSLDDFENIFLDEAKQQEITITWDTYSSTFEAELAALRRLTEDCQQESRNISHKSKAAFEMILDLRGSDKTFIDLHDFFPHLKNPAAQEHRIRYDIIRRYRSFNHDHLAAFKGLTRVPNGLYFVNGCPGAGKTEWNMIVSALLQSKKRPGAKRRSPILFLVDLNKTVDDAADRYYKLCKEAKLDLRIVRMHGWPYEIRNSSKLNTGGSGQNGNDDQQGTDFTKKFLATMNINKAVQIGRNPNKAPTLDEAAWEYYEKHKDGGFLSLKRVLTRMEAGEVLDHDNWKTLRTQVTKLYTAYLKQTDFVATTPVAVYGSFTKYYKPDIIFVDEAPHARELTTLIPIAYFEPIAWIFTGDVNQTRPFVKSGDVRDTIKKGLEFNPYADQMRLSLMARAEKVGAINSRLLINKRAYGNLQKLPSTLFYHGRMVSGYPAAKQFPTTVKYLRTYLENLGGGTKLSENRAVVSLTTSKEETHCRSFWNPVNHHWVMDQARKLLQDPDFRDVTNIEQPGRVMIQTPYSVAMRQYAHAVKQWPAEWQQRVEVLTVDKAQGNQADVVFLDMVRTTRPGFMDEAHRMNVAITRARQAEVILMHSGMTFRLAGGQRVPTNYTSKVWNDAYNDSRLFVL